MVASECLRHKTQIPSPATAPADDHLLEPARVHVSTYVGTQTCSMHLGRWPHPAQFVFPLQMSPTKGEPLMGPTCPSGSRPGRPRLKTEQGKGESPIQCMAGAGPPIWLSWQSLGPSTSLEGEAEGWLWGYLSWAQTGGGAQEEGGGRGSPREAGHELLEKQLVPAGLTAVTWKWHLA